MTDLSPSYYAAENAQREAGQKMQRISDEMTAITDKPGT
jgi:hypothetical protein